MSDAAPAPDPQGGADEAILARLAAAADDLEAKRDAVRPALELRDELIVEAIEAQISYRLVAKAARCSEGTVHGVLASH